MSRRKGASSVVVRRKSGAECREWGQDKGGESRSGRLCIWGRGAWDVFRAGLRGSPCFGDVGTVGGDDWVPVPEDAMTVTKGRAENTRVMDGLEEGGNGELHKFRSGTARDA